jgi:hypothetical protein
MKPIHDLSDDELARLVQRAAALPDAPAALVRAAIDLWRPPAPVESLRSTAQAAWRLVVATLSFDSWAVPAVAGMRALPSETRHLLFTACGRDIDVRISPAAVDDFCITGQILGPDASGSIELVKQSGDDPGVLHAAPLDPLGEFRLDGVRGGTYRMTLRTVANEIVMPPIVVGPRE